MTDPDRDEKVTQAYRALGGEAPSRALDEAILAASRRRPARWRVPLSIAAVLVLAVGVTLRMLPQPPDAESVALAPQVIETPRPAAVPVEPPASRTQSARAPAAASAERQAKIARNDAGAAAPGAVGALAQRTQTPTPTAEAPAQLQGAKPAEARAPAGAAVADAARSESAAGVATQALARTPAAAKSSGPALTPEEWLKRIAELRKEGREREAQESLAEFKKRYPDHKIPEALTR